MDLVAKGHIQEARNFFNTFCEDHEMMHLCDLQKLEGVLYPAHLKEMEFTHSLRKCKFNIKVCQVVPSLLSCKCKITMCRVILVMKKNRERDQHRL